MVRTLSKVPVGSRMIRSGFDRAAGSVEIKYSAGLEMDIGNTDQTTDFVFQYL